MQERSWSECVVRVRGQSAWSECVVRVHGQNAYLRSVSTATEKGINTISGRSTAQCSRSTYNSRRYIVMVMTTNENAKLERTDTIIIGTQTSLLLEKKSIWSSEVISLPVVWTPHPLCSGHFFVSPRLNTTVGTRRLDQIDV